MNIKNVSLTSLHTQRFGLTVSSVKKQSSQNKDLTNLRTHEIIYSIPQISFDGKEALKQNLKIMYI